MLHSPSHGRCTPRSLQHIGHAYLDPGRPNENFQSLSMNQLDFLRSVIPVNCHGPSYLDSDVPNIEAITTDALSSSA